jgi:NAD-dependent SIR2 family protein deacetylase
MKPHCMFFDESYTEKYHRATTIEEFHPDALIVVGTSFQTFMANKILKSCLEREDVPIVELNIEACAVKEEGYGVFYQGKCGKSLPEVLGCLKPEIREEKVK